MTKEPRPLTIKQERFCLVYFETGNATEAYRQAYNAAKMSERVINTKASLLSRQDKIRVRVNDLKGAEARKYKVTAESISRELDEARELAINIEQPSSAVSASLGKAKLYGLIDRDARREGAGFEVFGTRAERDGLLKQLLGASETITVVDMLPDEPGKS